ncbi:hypothetical protein [Pedobacter gandavensis]|uniref:Lipoprotein n=1 Tax=Pedobacter gandavensis TaxID=2679963 RepID=A0ABR6EUC9_9SPHI|nr:hypothetical protein [Pedobacter gandavensis]MBB2148878.1 hypothetical protein [Pedobacter gandavensis]
MKKYKNIQKGAFFLLVSAALSSCSMFGLDVQKDHEYIKKELDPNLYMTARQYLETRAIVPTKLNDTVFKYMKLGLDYAGIDLAEYEKPGRTFLFLHNDAIRVLDDKTKLPKSGFWFDLPIVLKDANGAPIMDPVTLRPKTRPATKWSDYSKETVKNYFLYLILQGDYGFNNAITSNTTLQTLLPPGTVAKKDESMLSYLVTKSTPDPAAAANTVVFTYNFTGAGSGFDPDGKINMKIVYSDGTPLRINDFSSDRSAGQIATNGQVHVFGTTVYPCRYSYL